MKKENGLNNEKLRKLLGFPDEADANFSFDEIVSAVSSYYERLILKMPGHVYWLDTDACTAGCNQNVLDSFGLNSIDEFIGLDYEQQAKIVGWTEEATASFKADTFEVIRTGKAKMNVEEPPVKDRHGRTVRFLTSRVPVFNRAREVIAVVGISTDITDLKNAQHELAKAKETAEAANHAKTEFVQNMQHDIRTPSAGLWGVLDLLANAESDEQKKEALDMAAAASKRLLDLCNDAVEFGDLEGNVRPIAQKVLDVRALGQSIIELNKPAAFAKDLIIHFKVSASVPPHIMADEFRLSRILINLLGNAIKFTHQGEISLSLKAQIEEETRKGFLTVELKDTGIGIPKDKREHIFEKFGRAVASNTNLYPGTGLGLYVVKTFVDELNGEIFVDSEENVGSCFKLNIPFKGLLEDMSKLGTEIDERFESPFKEVLKKEMTEEKIQKSSENKRLALNTPFIHKLLIIEDDKLCLFSEKNLLSAFTSHIDTAENVDEALQQLSEKRYDLVISDLGLPDGSGNDIVAKVTASPESPNYKTPFVAMTAHQDTLKHQEAMAAGFRATHTKPLSTEKAVELLNTYPAEGVTTPSKAEGYPVIDLALGMQRASILTENQAIEMLDILHESLKIDIPLLQQAEENNDLEGVQAILLKVSGGLSYAGTPRLEKASEALAKELADGGQDFRNSDILFSLLYDEAKLFAEQFKELKKGVNAEREAERLRLVNEEQKALLAQEEKFRLIVNQVAHDIRTPLASLSMMMKIGTHIPEAQRIALRETAMSIEDIANHLLHQYRKKVLNEEGEYEQRLDVLVSTLLLETLSIKKHQYAKHSVQFDCQFDANTHFAFIKIQATSFKRLLSNLINNAVDAFEHQPGTVHLGLEANNEWVKIRIQDTGKGMPADLMDKILHRTPVTQGKQSGHGLGFTQVWETLDHNQGELAMDSKPGFGTTITLTFPRSRAPYWIAEEIVLNSDDKIIILDDDNSIHAAWDARFEMLLNKNPHLELKHFQLGSAALEFIESLIPAERKHVFLFVDYELLKQKLNGLEIISKSGLARSLLVTSHYADPEIQAEAAKIGTQILPKQLASEVVITINN